MTITAGSWRAVPLRDCWQLQRKRVPKGGGEPVWVGVECYPSTAEQACCKLLERRLREADAQGVAGVLRAVEDARADVVRAVREAGLR
jgi:hypothetical protein